MFIFNANAYSRNPGGAATSIEEIVKTVNGEILASRLWNEQKLAYPINGQRKGAYWLTYVKMESTELPKFNRACQLNELILRHMVVKIEPRLVDAMVAVAKGETPAISSAEVKTSAENESEEMPDEDFENADEIETVES
jgi:small subunit ribosomal protein S6